MYITVTTIDFEKLEGNQKLCYNTLIIKNRKSEINPNSLLFDYCPSLLTTPLCRTRFEYSASLPEKILKS